MLENRIIHLAEGENQDRAYTSNILEQSCLAYGTLKLEVESWLESRKHLRRGCPKYGIFDPSTTIFSINLTALEKSAQDSEHKDYPFFFLRNYTNPA
jgi:hypothetical protein